MDINSFDEFPDEILLNIGIYMSAPTLEAMRLTSSKYQNLYYNLYKDRISKIDAKIKQILQRLLISNNVYFTIRYGHVEESYYSSWLDPISCIPNIHINIFTIINQKICDYKEMSNLNLQQFKNHIKSLDGLYPLYYHTYNGKPVRLLCD